MSRFWLHIAVLVIFFVVKPIKIVSAQSSPAETNQSWADQELWESLIDDLEYNPEKKVEQKAIQPELPKFNPDIPSSRIKTNPTTIAIIILCAIVVFVLIYFILNGRGSGAIGRNNKIDLHELSEDEILERLPELEIKDALDEAIANGEFKKAIRLYYLRILQSLIANGSVSWKPNKTNRNYVQEMRSHQDYVRFLGITNTFEWVWYSDLFVTQDTFETLQPNFKIYLQSLQAA